MHLKNLKALLMIIVLSTAVTACRFGSVYNENVSIKDAKWYKDEAVHFEVPVSDSLTAYDFILNLRNSTDYRYSNLYIFLTTRFPNGNLTRDTIEIVLADKQGRWLGTGWGKLKDNSIVLKKNLHFPLTGMYAFYVQQAMRTDTLEGIHDVGLEISKVVSE